MACARSPASRHAHSSLLRSALALFLQLSFEKLDTLFALFELGSFLFDDLFRRLVGESRFGQKLSRTLEHPLRFLELPLEPRPLFGFITLYDQPDLDRAYDRRRALTAAAERHFAVRQLADLLDEIAYGRGFAGERNPHPRGRIEP